jgi:hypothetical protein
MVNGRISIFAESIIPDIVIEETYEEIYERIR